jgi:membrane fusion protein
MPEQIGDMSTPLFREEALTHQREPVQGTLLLAASPRSTWLSLAAFTIAALLISYAWLGEFSRKAHVQGYLAPNKGLIKVYPPVIGTLLERRVEEGQAVRRGDVLAVVSTEKASLSVRAANDETIALLRERESSLEQELGTQAEIDRLRLRGIDDSLSSLQREQSQLDAAIDTVEQRLQAARKEARRFEQLEDDGFVAATQLQQQRDQVLEQRGRLQVLQRDRIALRGRLQQLRSERTTAALEATSRRAALRRQITEVKQERTSHESNSNVVIAAPTDGTVSTILIERGQQTRREAPLFSIIPDGASLEAKLLVPSHAIGFITPQQQVALRYGAFPYQRFGHYRGVVSSIAKTLLLPGDAKLPLPLKEPAYLVTVALQDQSIHAYGKTFPLQAGMALDGDVILDRRSIIQWIFDPLFSLVQRS